VWEFHGTENESLKRLADWLKLDGDIDDTDVRLCGVKKEAGFIAESQTPKHSTITEPLQNDFL
jgi:hypothetical protein